MYKKQSCGVMKHYQPVSLLSIVSKVIERIISTCIMNYLEKEKLLRAHQFGFCPGLSAADLLTSLNHTWLEIMDAGGAVRVIAADIAGTFGKVSHLGVLHKLHSYGIAGPLHRWLTDYFLCAIKLLLLGARL